MVTDEVSKDGELDAIDVIKLKVSEWKLEGKKDTNIINNVKTTYEVIKDAFLGTISALFRNITNSFNTLNAVIDSFLILNWQVVAIRI